MYEGVPLNIRGWFRSFRAGEEEILGLLNRHVELSLKASKLMRDVFQALLAGDHAAAYVAYLEIDKAETEADDVHRELVDKLSTGVFFANLGTDLMNLAENVDGIADSAKAAAKVLIQRRLEPTDLVPIRERVVEHLEVTERAVSSLQTAIQGMGNGKGELVNYAHQVEEYEESADVIRDALMEQIFTLDISVLSVLQLKEFIGMVDNVSDSAEDGADILYILVSKGYS
jgi:predicted phosphate transport protein (TIGR00153 family)